MPIYTPEQQAAMDRKAEAAAKREYDEDPNRADPAGNHDRAVKAVKDLRRRSGLKD